MDWYDAILPDTVGRSEGRIGRVLVYRDIERAIDHAPPVAVPWALMVQYLLPFDPSTASEIWQTFVERFLVRTDAGTWVQVIPQTNIEDIRATCLATWLALEIGDQATYAELMRWVENHYEPRHDTERGEFGYWFNLDEAYPRGQWNNAIVNGFVAPPGTWTSILGG